MYVAAVDTAAGVLSDLGHEVVDIEPPFDPDVMTLFGAVWAVLAALPPPRGGSEEAFTPLVRWLRERARTASAIDLGQALAGLQARVATATARLDRVDLTLCPTLASARGDRRRTAGRCDAGWPSRVSSDTSRGSRCG